MLSTYVHLDWQTLTCKDFQFSVTTLADSRLRPEQLAGPRPPELYTITLQMSYGVPVTHSIGTVVTFEHQSACRYASRAELKG